MDNHATTRVDPRVVDRMVPYFGEVYGNAASSQHSFGWRAQEAVEVARKHCAELLGATAPEIVFTSGATEANNLAILGVTEAYAAKGQHVITQSTEHPAVLDACRELVRRGGEVTLLDVDSEGRVSVEAVRAALKPTTVLVSIMHANNEIGAVQPISEIASVCAEVDVLFHTDAAQTAGKIPIDVTAMGVHLLSISAHKLYGPKGVGLLYVRRKDPRVKLQIQSYGGSQERGRRSGTLNVPGIVGLGEACRLAKEELPQEGPRCGELRDALHRGLEQSLGAEAFTVNGPPVGSSDRLPGNLHVSFRDVDAERLLLRLQDLAVSSGAACASASRKPSPVLTALGVSAEAAQSSIRFGIGRFNTSEEVDFAVQCVTNAVLSLREDGDVAQPQAAH